MKFQHAFFQVTGKDNKINVLIDNLGTHDQMFSQNLI